MKIVKTVAELQTLVQQEKENGKSVGFVPTMGALHVGHVSLVERSCKENGCSVVSIFVNPTQFNNAGDLEHYPRTLEADCLLLQDIGVDYVFIPSVEEVYPEEDTRQFDFGQIDKVMEGAFRPGHFNGVAQVVSKLFDMVNPDKAYFGEKDFQQLAIIKDMVKQYSIPVEIIPCSIVRESDGLAMSSRNTRLTPEHRQAAPLIAKVLMESKEMAKAKSVAEIKQYVIDSINAESLLEVEYYDIVDALTLQRVSNWSEADNIVGCIAVFAGEIRLIDNVLYR